MSLGGIDSQEKPLRSRPEEESTESRTWLLLPLLPLGVRQRWELMMADSREPDSCK